MTIPQGDLPQKIPPSSTPFASTPIKAKETESNLPSDISKNLASHTESKTTTFHGSQPSINKILKKFEDESLKAETYIEIVKSLEPSQAARIEDVVNFRSEEIIKDILEKGKSEAASLQVPISKNVAFLKSDVDLSAQFTPFLIEDDIVRGLPELDISVVGTNILSRGCMIFAQGLLINRVEDVIEAKLQNLKAVRDENEIASIKNEIKILQNWIKVQLNNLSGALKSVALSTGLAVPKTLSAILVLASATKTVISSVVDWIGLGFGTISSALNLYISKKNYDMHTVWTEVITDKDSFDDVVERQNTIRKIRLESNKPHLDNLLAAVQNDLESSNLTEANQKLKKAGIEIPEEVQTVDQLQEHLLDPEKKDSFNEMMVGKKEALSVSLRKGLIVFNQKKDEIDRGFLKTKLGRDAGIFTVAAIMTSLAIVLKVLITVGVIATTAALTGVGFGVMAFVIGTLVLGAVYLYYKKPNIFKTYLNGVQLQLLFWKIPHSMQSLRHNFAILEEMKVAEQVKEIGSQILEAKRLLKEGNDEEIKSFLNDQEQVSEGINAKELLQNYKTKLKESKFAKLVEAKELDDKLSDLKDSIIYFEEKITPLQDKVTEAGWLDFQKLNAFVPVKAAQGDEADILAEYLLQDATIGEDSETRRLLLHMDIDINKLSEENLDLAKEKTAQMIRSFFAMETDTTLGMIAKQNLLEKHGLRENTARDKK